jgi:hypothetical protein
MKAVLTGWAVCLSFALAAGSASAQVWYPCVPQAPDACNPGYICTNCCGMMYGPNHCVRPPGLPFNGMIPGPPPGYNRNYAGLYGPGNCPGSPWGSPNFPTHPWARSPRDFFMVGD